MFKNTFKELLSNIFNTYIYLHFNGMHDSLRDGKNISEFEYYSKHIVYKLLYNFRKNSYNINMHSCII